MFKRLSCLVTLLALGTFGNFSEEVNAKPMPSSLDAEAAEAIEDPELPQYNKYVSDIFGLGYFHNSGDFFYSTSYAGQLNLLLGFDQFPENQITMDTEILQILTKDFFKQLTAGEPIRTRDLENPYQTSLQESPSYYIPFTP